MDGSSQVAVRPFQPDDSGRWDDFVRDCAAGTFFHLSPWRRVIERAFGHRTHYLLAERAGNLTGVLPLTHVKSALFGSSLIANAFGVQGGPIAADDASMRALEGEAVRLMDRLGVPVLEMRGASKSRADWPTKSGLYAIFRKAIDPSVEANLKAVPRKQRAMIRKGIQNGLQSEIDDDVDRLHRIYAEVCPQSRDARICQVIFSYSQGRIPCLFGHRHRDLQWRGGGGSAQLLFSGRGVAFLWGRDRDGARTRCK